MSTRVSRRVDDAHEFVQRVVDPLVVQAVTFLVVEKPADVLVALHAFLLALESGFPVAPKKDSPANTEEMVLADLKPILMAVTDRAVTLFEGGIHEPAIVHKEMVLHLEMLIKEAAEESAGET
mmetsp:Transcript_19201/g.39540  ORF Transcript_19201/g.39540 Transcript_19201/m.39540 type:complete len:123 (+) Transcript_19201:195-563(+)